jgi:hypothetical protein
MTTGSDVSLLSCLHHVRMCVVVGVPPSLAAPGQCELRKQYGLKERADKSEDTDEALRGLCINIVVGILPWA